MLARSVSRRRGQYAVRALGALLLVTLVACDYVAWDPGRGAPSSTTLVLVASPSTSPSPSVLDDRFGYVVSDGHGTSKVRGETSDVAITTFMPQGRSWTSLSRDVSPDGRSIAYWAPALDGAVLHVRVAGTGADHAVFTTASEMSGNTFAWSSDSTGIAVAIDNDCQEICALQGGTPKQELWTVDVATGASERIASGQYFLPVAWDRAARRIAAGVTGPGGYLVGYEVIDLSKQPAAIGGKGFNPTIMGQLRASTDARFVSLIEYGSSGATLSWWPLAEPDRRARVTFDGNAAEWRPGTSELWWVGGLTPNACAAPPCRGTTLVSLDVATGVSIFFSGSFGGTIVGFRADGTAAMTWSRTFPDTIIAVDVTSRRTATLPTGGQFVRVR